MPIKPAKPRNPHALSASRRRGNAHGSYRPERRERRNARQALRLQLKQDLKKENEHA